MSEHEQPYWFSRYNALVRRILRRWEPGQDRQRQVFREANAAWDRLYHEALMIDLGGEG